MIDGLVIPPAFINQPNTVQTILLTVVPNPEYPSNFTRPGTSCHAPHRNHRTRWNGYGKRIFLFRLLRKRLFDIGLFLHERLPCDDHRNDQFSEGIRTPLSAVRTDKSKRPQETGQYSPRSERRAERHSICVDNLGLLISPDRRSATTQTPGQGHLQGSPKTKRPAKGLLRGSRSAQPLS
jgi:hypothetical protein